MLDQNNPAGETEPTESTGKWHAQHHSITKSERVKAREMMDGSTSGDAVALVNRTPLDKDQEPADDAQSKALKEAEQILLSQKLSAAEQIAKVGKETKVIILDPPLAGVSDLPSALPADSVMAVNFPDALKPVFDSLFNNHDPKKPNANPGNAEIPDKITDNDSEQVQNGLKFLKAVMSASRETREFLQHLSERGIKIIPIGRSDPDAPKVDFEVQQIRGDDGQFRPYLEMRPHEYASHDEEIKDRRRTETYRADSILKLRQQYPDATIVTSLPDSGMKAHGTKPEVTSAADLIESNGVKVTTFTWATHRVPIGVQDEITGQLKRTTAAPTRSADNSPNAIGGLPTVDVAGNATGKDLASFDYAMFYR